MGVVKKKPNTYRHIEKDPIIDLIRTEAQRVYGKALTKEHRDKMALDSHGGVTSGTLYNWFNGNVKRPQSLTTRFALEAIGIRVAYIRADGTEAKLKGSR